MMNSTFLQTSVFEIIFQTNYNTESNTEISEYINKTESIYKTKNFVINGNNEEIYQGVLDNVIQNYDISSGEEMAYKGEDNFFFHITNSQNELDALKGKSNRTNKFSVIDLGECENLLKIN